MKEDEDEQSASAVATTRYPCMPSLVALQQMRNRLQMAHLGKRLMKWTALATGREMRRVALEINELYENFGSDVREAYIMLARGRYFYPNLNTMVIQNSTKNAVVTAEVINKTIAGCKYFGFEIRTNDEDPYPHLGIEKGGQAIEDAKQAWLDLLLKLLTIMNLRIAFKYIDIANRTATKKMNVLGKLVIPRTTLSVAYILSELEELAREDFFRLKKVIKMKEKIKMRKAQLALDKLPKAAVTPEPKEEEEKVIIEEMEEEVIHDDRIKCANCQKPLEEGDVMITLTQTLEEKNKMEELRMRLAEFVEVTRSMENRTMITRSMEEFLVTAEDVKAKLDGRINQTEEKSEIEPDVDMKLLCKECRDKLVADQLPPADVPVIDIMPVIEPVMEPSMEPSMEPVMEPIIEPVMEPVIEKQPIAPEVPNEIPVQDISLVHVVVSRVVSPHTVTELIVAERIKSEHNVPVHVEPEHVVPEHVIPEHIVPEYVVPEHVVSEHIVPAYVAPEHVVSEHVVPEYVVPEHVVSEHVVSKRGSPKHVVIVTAGPDEIVSSHVVPEYVVPEHVVPEHVVPEHVVPEHVAPGHVVLEDAVIEHVLPAHIVPEHVVPEHVESGNIVPEHVVPKQVVPEHIILEDVVLQDLVKHVIPEHSEPIHVLPKPVVPEHVMPEGVVLERKLIVKPKKSKEKVPDVPIYHREPPQPDIELGVFETEIKEVTKVVRVQNEDGTITEEKRVIRMKREIREPQRPNVDDSAKCTYQGSETSNNTYPNSKTVGIVSVKNTDNNVCDCNENISQYSDKSNVTNNSRNQPRTPTASNSVASDSDFEEFCNRNDDVLEKIITKLNQSKLESNQEIEELIHLFDPLTIFGKESASTETEGEHNKQSTNAKNSRHTQYEK